MIRKILIVDDEKDLLSAFAELLEEHGFEVCTASDGREFEELFFLEHPDLVIMDIVLPNETGPDLYSRVTQIHPESKPPVIFASGLVDAEAELRIVRGRQVAMYSKPIHVEKLVRDIHAAFPPSIAA